MDIKINSGFFKTEKYVLAIEKERLVLLSDQHENISILKEDINTLNLLIKNLDLIEIEIYTKEKNYSGVIDEVINIEPVVRYFKEKLGDRCKIALR